MGNVAKLLQRYNLGEALSNTCSVKNGKVSVVTERGGSVSHPSFPYRIIKPTSRISAAHITLMFPYYTQLLPIILQDAIQSIVVQKILKIAGQHLANPLADERQFNIMSSFAAVIC